MTTKITYFAAFCLVAFSASCVFAQSRSARDKDNDVDKMASAYTIIKPVSSEAQNLGEVTRLLQSDTLSDEAKTTINSYLQRFFLARWTDPNNATNFANYKKELNDLVEKASSVQGKEFLLSRLTDLLYGFATKTDFYPACRYNAVLALGELNSGQTDGRPVPYYQALLRLYRIYVNKGDGKDSAHEAIRLGALLGIRRHVILGISNAKARDEQIAKLLMGVAADTPYPKIDASEDEIETSMDRSGTQSIVVKVEANAEHISEKYRTVDQHNWFRNRAIDTLGYLNNAKPETQAQIIDTLLTLIENDGELPSIQYAAAYSLSNFTTQIANSPELLKRTTEAMLQLSLTVCKDGVQMMIAEKSTRQMVSSMSSGGSSSGMSMGMGTSMGGGLSGGGSDSAQLQADQINNSLIQIKDGFSSIQICLAGPNFRSGGVTNIESIKNSPYHEILVGLNKSIVACVKFLDEGDPDAKKRVQPTSMDTTMGMGMSSGISSSGGLGTTTTVKNQPKVTMTEIENRLKTFRGEVEVLQNVMTVLETGVAAPR